MRPRGGVPGREIDREVRVRGTRWRATREDCRRAREARGAKTRQGPRGDATRPLPPAGTRGGPSRRRFRPPPLCRRRRRSPAPPLRSSAKMNLLLLVAINSFVPQLKEDIKIALRHSRAPIDRFSLKAVSPCLRRNQR